MKASFIRMRSLARAVSYVINFDKKNKIEIKNKIILQTF